MTDKEILQKVIDKAQENGYYPHQKIDLAEWDLDELLLSQGQYDDYTEWAVRDIIFDHDFAKALWGDKGIIPAWEYHLMKLALEKEPLKYLEKFL